MTFAHPSARTCFRLGWLAALLLACAPARGEGVDAKAPQGNLKPLDLHPATKKAKRAARAPVAGKTAAAKAVEAQGPDSMAVGSVSAPNKMGASAVGQGPSTAGPPSAARMAASNTAPGAADGPQGAGGKPSIPPIISSPATSSESRKPDTAKSDTPKTDASKADTKADAKPAIQQAAVAPTALPQPPSEAQLYCSNIAATAADARFAWQAKRLAELETQLRQSMAELEAKQTEYKEWLAKRDEAQRKAADNVVAIYSRMRPEAAASQLAVMEDGIAAAILAKLNARSAGAILNEMEAGRAARLTDAMAGLSAARNGKKS